MQQPFAMISPAAQELADFQDFMRRETMRLVEASVLSVISAEIEERLGNSLVNIVDSCQSLAMQNYHKFKSETSYGGEPSHTLAQQAVPSSSEPVMLYSPRPFTPTLESSSQEPVAISYSDLEPVFVEGRFADPHYNITPDSGYNSGYDLCMCTCHWSVDLGAYSASRSSL